MSATQEPSKPLNRLLLTLILLLLLAIIWSGVRLVFPDNPTPFAGTRPDNLGLTEGKLAPCPNTPNCVSSQSEDSQHAIEPLTYEGKSEEAFAALKTIIQSEKRTKIVTETGSYLYVEFSTPLLGFVDDVEFYEDEAKKAIDVRSASRLGESDLGVNRQRIEKIRSQFISMN